MSIMTLKIHQQAICSYKLLFLPVYWYALSFEDYRQLSARLKNKGRKTKKMSQIRRVKERKKEVKLDKGKGLEDVLYELI